MLNRKSLNLKNLICHLLAALTFISLVTLPLNTAYCLDKPNAEIPQPVFDFGSVIDGATVKHEFVVRNTGSAVLELQKVIPACGCTAATIGENQVQPGAEGRVRVEFATLGHPGDKTKQVQVLTNDIDHPTLILTLRGTVEQDFIVEPDVVNLPKVVRGKGALSEPITVKVKAGSNARIVKVSSYTKLLTVEKLTGSDTERTFRVKISPEARTGLFRDRIVVLVVNPKQKQINIPVRAEVVDPLRIEPSSVALGILPNEQIIERSVKISSISREGVSVQDVRSNNSAVTAELKTMEDRQHYVVKLKIDSSLLSQSGVKELRAIVEIDTEIGVVPLEVYGTLPVV